MVLLSVRVTREAIVSAGVFSSPKILTLSGIAEPEELASVALFLASPAGSYVNGVNLPVDGGRVAKG